MRMEAQTPQMEAGHMLIPKEAPWLAVFLDELLAFPYGKHDDQVDSVSQFLGWIVKRRRYNGSGAAPEVFIYDDPASLNGLR